jgi:predicted NAD/FAD-binding protein
MRNKMLTKNKKQVQIPRKDWDNMKQNPTFSEVIELLEDISDLEEAKKVKGKELTLEQYLSQRELSNNN